MSLWRLEPAMDAGEVSAAAVAEVFRNLVLMLAPFAPFFAAEMWEQIGGEGVVFRTAWPVADEELARENEIEIPVQVNGKLVNVVKVPAGSDEATVKAAALADEKVKARIEGKTCGEGDRGAGQACESCGEVVERCRRKT